MKHLTLEEIKTLMDDVKGTSLEAVVHLAVLFALRNTEVCALKWGDIDLEHKTITVRDALIGTKLNGGGLAVKRASTKINTDNGVFPLNDKVCDYLKSLRQHQMAIGKGGYDDYVCLNEAGYVMSPSHITYKFHRLSQAHGLKSTGYVHLRHSCIILLANSSYFSEGDIFDYGRYCYRVGNPKLSNRAEILNYLTDLLL